MRRARLGLLLVLVLAAGGCGAGDVGDEISRQAERLKARAEVVRKQIDQVRKDAGKVGERLADRVRKRLEQLRKSVPTANRQTQPPATRGRTGTTTIDAFLTDVLKNVDAYWTRTLRASGSPPPTVRYDWIPPGRAVPAACGTVADDHAAFYCPRDDTIYVGQALAAGVFRGVRQGFPGEEAGQGRAVGDFGVAYLVAHEYAHNIQEELGFFTSPGAGTVAKPFELQADCMAGLWGNSVFRAGKLHPGDVEEALSTALAVGDFDVNAKQHHGTPAERREAWLLGYRSGDPSVCRHFVRA